MTKKQATELFQQGELLRIVEYRSASAAVIDYRDKKTGTDAAFAKETNNVEAGSLAFTVGVMMPRGTWERDPIDKKKVKDWKPRFRKGQMLVLRVATQEQANGVVSCSGTLEPLED